MVTMQTLTRAKEGIKLQDVLNTVAEDSVGKTDYSTTMDNLHMFDNGMVAFKNVRGVEGSDVRDLQFRLTDWALSQSLGKLGMPVQYFKKAREENPDLLAQHFNYWSRKSDGAVMLRSRVQGDAATIRGVVSDKYSVLDNDMSMEALAQILKGQEDGFRVRDFHMDDRRMHMRITYTDMTKQVGFTKDGKPDYLQLGMDAINSEVGAASFNIAGLIWRLVCTNGLRRWEKNGDDFTQRHAFLKTNEFRARVGAAMVTSLGSSEHFLNNFADKMEIKVQNPFDVIKKLAKRGDFSQEFTEKAGNYYEGDGTAYGIVNAFTAAARDLSNERRLDTEKFAGKLVTLKPSAWVRIDTTDTDDTELKQSLRDTEEI